MVLERPGMPLNEVELETPVPGRGQVLLKISACAVCRTDLHILDGELPNIPEPIIPGHEIIGRVVAAGEDTPWKAGTRLGVPWLGYTCGQCRYCTKQQENLCDRARFTGYQINGGFAEYTLADARYCFEISDAYSDVHAAPLLCAGLIGYRALGMTGDAFRIGIYGFGAAAHIITQVAVHQQREIYAFTRPGDIEAQQFAKRLGAKWSGESGQHPGVELDAAIIFAPVGSLVPQALAELRKGGIVVCGGIHMSDIPGFPYHLLWQERMIRSVANLTRRDAQEFLALAPQIPVTTEVECFALHDANLALERLRKGHLQGAAVLTMD